MQPRVLLIDDNRDAVELLQIVLEYLGYEVQIALSGEQGLELAETFQPDAVISDIGMPGMLGYEVAETIRKSPRLSTVLLLALTGWNDEKTSMRVVHAGFDRHLTKPVDLPLLKEILSEHFCGLAAHC
jgi:CheY-like chemotaxis protein